MISWKKFDIPTLEKLSIILGVYGKKIYNEMYDRWIMINPAISEYQMYNFEAYFSPTWFANGWYELQSGDPLRSLRGELDRKWLKRLLVWHWFNKKEDFSDLSSEYAQKYYDTVIRLERCDIPICYETDSDYWYKMPIYGNFGYCVVDKNNVLLEVGDAKDIVKIGF